MAKRPRELPLEEAFHIHMTPAEERLNRDTGLKISGCWVAPLRKHETRTKLCHSATSGVTSWWALHESWWHQKSSVAISRTCSGRITIFTLKRTSAFWSKCWQNVQPASSWYRITLYRGVVVVWWSKAMIAKQRQWGMARDHLQGSEKKRNPLTNNTA